MKILLIHPNYHSGGAEIAGNWPPAWVAYISGALKSAGFTDVKFIDAMTDHIEDEPLATLLRAESPDVVLCTSITPAIYKAQEYAQDGARHPPQRGDGVGWHPRHVHVRAGVERSPVDRLHRAG